MTAPKENPPVLGEHGGPSDNATNTTRIPDPALLSPEQISDLTSRLPRMADVWNDGYMWGLIHGRREGEDAAALSQEQQADLAARRFYALELWEIDLRRLTKSAAEFIDVAASRDAMYRGERA